MKREIKFRAWNKKEKIMGRVTVVDFNDLLLRPEEAQIALRTEQHKHNGIWYPYKDLELMQYTGLKDKNGKDIFEGDQLKQEGLEVEVKWSGFDAGFVFEDESGSQMIVTSGNSNQWEVVGNIWEQGYEHI